MIKILIPGYADRTINYQNALLTLGMIPIVRHTYQSIESTDSYCALLLPGGGDIDPSFFDAPNLGSRNIDTRIDLVQYHYLHDFVKAKKPVLGICKGMQMINIFFGGTIKQDMSKESLLIHTQTQNATDRLHPIHPFSPQIQFPSLTVNSAHHQCIDKLGDGLMISHVAQDQVIEGIYHNSLPVIGVQWHPERLLSWLSCIKTDVLL